ncbi:MAG: hypothetical protein WCA10_20375 [Terracidiphilus sp.]
MYYGKVLRQIAESIQSLAADIQSGIERISSKIESASAENKAENAKEKPEQKLEVTAVLHRDRSEIEAESARETHKEIRASSAEFRDRIRLYVEVTALIIGVVVAGANVALWIQTKESTRIARIAADAAKAGADASKAQVEATKESIDETVKNFRLDQRAWIGPKSFDLLPMNAPDLTLPSECVSLSPAGLRRYSSSS